MPAVAKAKNHPDHIGSMAGTGRSVGRIPRGRFRCDEAAAIGMLALIGLVVVGGAVVVGGSLYAADYKLSADVTGKECGGGALNTISVKTKALGIDHDVQGVPPEECRFIQVGDEVDYRIRTKQTTVYRDGVCVYDSVTGPGCGQGPVVPAAGLFG